MTNILKTTLFGIAAAFASFGMVPEAKADGDYCREYTRTVYIGGRAQEAYGKACQQPNGDWVIVGEGLGNDIPNNVSDVDYVIHDNRQEIIPNRVLYYSEPRVQVYRSRPVAPIFVWSNNGHYRNGQYIGYKKHYGGNNYYGRNDWRGRDRDRYDHRDRHDRDDHRGHGRGHDRD